MTEWEVYIIQTEKNTLYTGITTDLDRRLSEHQGRGKGARYFRLAKAGRVVFRERHPNRSSATKREAQIKAMSRTQKLALIAAAPRQA